MRATPIQTILTISGSNLSSANYTEEHCVRLRSFCAMLGSLPEAAVLSASKALQRLCSKLVRNQCRARINGSKLSFDWVKVSSPADSSYELRVEGTDAFATFSRSGRYVLDRWVGYRLSSTLTHRYILDIGNSLPKAKIEAPMSGTIDVPLALDASKSFDYENSPLQYLWTLTLRPIGSLSVFDDTNAEVTELVPDKAGEYRIALNVFDELPTHKCAI